MNNKRRMILASQLVTDNEKPAFPIYLTSVEGAGKERTVEPNSDILSFIEYADKISSFNDFGHWELPVFEKIFVIDGIPFTVGEGYGSNEQWDSFMLYASNDYTGDGWWAGAIQRNGHINIWDDA